ncbi:MAG: hypothetical protein AAB539_00935 [Patescibacteria group bacterium]
MRIFDDGRITFYQKGTLILDTHDFDVITATNGNGNGRAKLDSFSYVLSMEKTQPNSFRVCFTFACGEDIDIAVYKSIANAAAALMDSNNHRDQPQETHYRVLKKKILEAVFHHVVYPMPDHTERLELEAHKIIRRYLQALEDRVQHEWSNSRPVISDPQEPAAMII